MKKSVHIFMLLALGLLPGGLLYAQWQNNGPEGGMVYNVISNGNDLLCHTPGGVYLSADAGTTWAASRSGMPRVEIRSVITHKGKFIAGTGDGLYAYSGTQWSKVSSNQLKLCYSRGNYLFGLDYLQSTRMLFRSADDGTSFQNFTVSFDITSSMASLDTILFIGAHNGVRYSVNNGQTWQNLNITYNGAGIGKVNDLRVIQGGLLIAAETGVFKHNGNIYSNVVQFCGNGIPLNEVIPSSITTLNGSYALSVSDKNNTPITGNMSAMYYSADGINWTTPLPGKYPSKVFTLCTHGSAMFICSSAGLIRTADQGSTWSLAVNGIKAHIISDLKTDGGKLYVAVKNSVFNTGYYTKYGGGAFVSSDKGASWQKLGLPDSLAIHKIFVKGMKLMVYATCGSAQILLRSDDAGATWSTVTGFSGMVYNDNAFFINDVVYLTSPASIESSTDFGTTWQSTAITGIPLTSTLSLEGMGTKLVAYGSQYINSNGGIFTSSDGTSWTASNNGIMNNMPVLLVKAADNNTLIALQNNYVMGIGAAVYKSVDQARNWTSITEGLPMHVYGDVMGWTGNYYLSSGYNLNGSMINLNGIDSGAVFESRDGGATWNNISGDLPQVSFTKLAVLDSTLFTGAFGYSVWSRAVTPGNGSNTGLANAEKTKQPVLVYPNPASSMVCFSLHEGISASSGAILQITDLSGRVIYSEQYKGKSMSVNVQNIPRGVYLYHISGDDGLLGRGKVVIR